VSIAAIAFSSFCVAFEAGEAAGIFFRSKETPEVMFG
jgi:hypothetical protein